MVSDRVSNLYGLEGKGLKGRGMAWKAVRTGERIKGSLDLLSCGDSWNPYRNAEGCP